MAPRGGPRTQGSAQNTKSTSMKSKAGSRGGIQKKRAGTKTDVDGDLDMDSAARRNKPAAGADGAQSRPNTRSSSAMNPRGTSRVAQTVAKHLGTSVGDVPSRGLRARRAQNAPGLSYLRIHGLKQSKAASNQDGGVTDLLSFLERKASSFTAERRKRSIIIKKSHLVGDYVFIGANKEDAEEILKLNTFNFAGATLEIVESTEGLGQQSKATESKETQELRAKLQSILSQRYIGASKLLKLDALSGDAELVTLGMFETRERALKTFKGLMAICDGLFKTAQEKRDAIESISLASNGIDDVSQVESVANTFPQLKNLDMSGNQLANMKAMERWKGKFKELETLYTTGNPVEADASFQAALLEWFPKLQIINGTQLRTAEQIAQREEQLKPKPIPQNGPDFRDVNGIGENFLVDFFTAYDSDRQGLVSRYYDEGSQFSLAVDTQSVRDASGPAPLPWASYIKFSRNLIKITHQNARVQRLFKGAASIYDLWKNLPMTQHPNIKTDMSRYIMDCHPLPGLVDPTGQNPLGVDGLIISVHGQFDEYDSKSGTTGKRSFSRTFILGPGQPGGGPIRVVSDMISLRAYGELPNVFVPQAPAPAAAPASGTAAAPAGTEQSQHQVMLAELCKQTGMVPQYSEMCLSQVGWDFDKALVIFNEKKAQLPPEAFASGKP